MLWVNAGVGLVWITWTAAITVGAIIDHHTQVDSGGQLFVLSGNDPAAGSWNTAFTAIFLFVAVAVATLAAAALFNPLRRRTQKIVDLRFNRARYDADQVIVAFAARLNDVVNLDSIREDLVAAVDQALEPAHISVWISPV